MVYLLAFHANINKMHGSRSKIPITKSRQAALRGGRVKLLVKFCPYCVKQNKKVISER
jgi:hypothetical protein